MLLLGDCLEHLKTIESESVDLCYIDPPFATNSDFIDFKDTMDLEKYLVWIEPILKDIYRCLKPIGSFYIHIDAHASHYVKILLDSIFGRDRFVNNIVWKRRTGFSNAKNRYDSCTDDILFYTKTKEFVFNTERLPLTSNRPKSSFKKEGGTDRIYITECLHNSFIRSKSFYYVYKGYQPPEKGWRVNEDRMKSLDESNMLVFPIKKNGLIKRKYYVDEMQGRSLSNLWDDIDQYRKLRDGDYNYATQKPIALLERIISVSSNPGDTVLDCFVGSGTTLVAAQKLGRKFIGIDVSEKAIEICKQRLNVTLS